MIRNWFNMGIRIHKYLGYGLVDLNTEENDSRFNPNGIISLYQESGDDEVFRWSVGGFLQHCEEIADRDDNFELKLMLKVINDDTDRFKTHLTNHIIYDQEDGLPNVILFTPFDSHDWGRYDDIIDYYDYDGYGVEPVIKVLDRPIYPHIGYINNETGERADSLLEQSIISNRNAYYNLKFDRATDENDVELNHHIMEVMLERLGCELHWTEKWNVVIPTPLIEFLRYTEVFTDDSTIWKLQPMIYTFWS